MLGERKAWLRNGILQKEELAQNHLVFFSLQEKPILYNVFKHILL